MPYPDELAGIFAIRSMAESGVVEEFRNTYDVSEGRGPITAA